MRDDSIHGHHQIDIRFIIFFAAKNGEAKQDRELTGSDHELLIVKFRLKLKKVRDTVQEAVIKTIPKKKKCKKAKWLSEEALQISVKREAKGKGEKDRYNHVNAEFQKIAPRDKKAFLSDQCKERGKL